MYDLLLIFALKFWDTRAPSPMLQLQLPERAYCVDVVRYSACLIY